ncbi:MAG: hypothetical protein KDK38_14140, partial [Leptospiraceae bacterium]|nr:hypothetical protein [Leptospiraceae bacterium]
MKRKIYKIALVTALCSFSLIVSSCSLLKPEKNNNCLNPTADCFVSDVTRPYVVSAFGYRNEAEYLAGTTLGNGEGTSQLFALKVVF